MAVLSKAKDGEVIGRRHNAREELNQLTHTEVMVIFRVLIDQRAIGVC